MEEAVADVASERHRDAGAEVDRRDRKGGLDHRDPEHQGAGVPDVVRVAPKDPLVDDARIQVRQVEVGCRLNALEAEQDVDLPLVAA